MEVGPKLLDNVPTARHTLLGFPTDLYWRVHFMTPFLECGPLSTSVNDGRVLFEDVSVTLPEHECVCLEGPSGSGKSTLLRLLTALAWSPDVNRRLNGRTYTGAELPTWRANVSMIAQDAPMIRGTVLDNLSFPFIQRSGQDKVFTEQAAIQLLGDVGLGDLSLDRDVLLLSGGERHRLALVRGLLWDPPVLIADESLSGLDPDSAEACFELLLNFSRRHGRLSVCVLHDPKLRRTADRRLQLSNGHLEEC